MSTHTCTPLLATCLLSLALIAPTAHAAQPQGTDLHPACRTPGQAVAESGYVMVGGIRQWVTIDGEDCTNPVVLMVHGGPGNPSTPFARQMFGAWHKSFTLVQWDQRGAGKTFAESRPGKDELLSLERLVDDGIEVARHASQRLGQRKLVLMGGSWGSVLAVHMALRAPERFHAYVGTAQLVSYPASVKASYAMTLSLAKTAGDGEAVGKLEALGPPPWTDPRAVGTLRRVTRQYEAQGTDAPPKGWFAFGPGYDTPDDEAAYEAGEDHSFLSFVGLKGDGMASRIDLRRLGLRFAMPVYLLQGDQDLVTPPALSRAYFDELEAPHKRFVSLPRTGHTPNRAMVDAQFAVLLGLRAEALKAEQR